MAHVVILAAGEGQRMRSPIPKCLLPVTGSHGTLDLLLDWCAPDATVVHRDATVAAYVEQQWPGVRCRRNTLIGSGLLQSLVVGSCDLEPRPLVVLLGDTVYANSFREAIDGWDGHMTAVVVHRPTRPADTVVTPAEIPVDVSAGRVTGIGAQLPRDFEMASAVLWAAQDWHVFRDAVGRSLQAEALDDAIAQGLHVTALEVPADSFFDVDTPDDLHRARRRLL